ncbi:hypothetical protein VPH49_21820 [Pseudomonas luteola]|uniref:hypothetical protein n=1 Tax=Pseudomonas luteola TaxID=47886 RepID=UPI003A8AFCB6
MTRSANPLHANYNVAPVRKAFAKKTEKTPVAIEVLYDILKRPRFADSDGEAYVIEKYLLPLPNAWLDPCGNIWVQVGTGATTMFACHTDTVHKMKAPNVEYALLYDNGMLTQEGSTCLGADCGTGIWIMLNMIEAGVPGLYIFHREEESGRIGSEWIVENMASALGGMGIKRCISFDRKGTKSIISHQSGERCCSQAFIDDLAAQLGTKKHEFEADDGGSYTDSYAYRGIIAECTNLSVGYYDQHSKGESQDVPFAAWLVNRLIQVDWESISVEREPKLEEYGRFGWGGFSYDGYRSDVYGVSERELEDIRNAVTSNLDAVCELLLDQGFTPYEIESL